MTTSRGLQAFWSTAIWYLGGAAAIQGINFIAQPLFALLMTPAELGVSAAYLFWMTAFGLVIGFQAQAALNNVRATHGEASLATYISSVLPWYLLPTALLLGLLVLAPSWWGAALGLRPGYLALAIANGVLFAASAMGMAHALTLGLRRRYLTLMIAVTLAPLPLGLTLVVLLEDAALGRILGYFIGSFLVVAVLAATSVGGRTTPQRTLLKFGVLITLPLLVHELLYLVMNQANRVFLISLVNENAAGVFAFAFGMGNIAVVAATAVNSSWTPWYFEHTKHGEDARVRRTATDLLVAFAAAISALALVSPEALLAISRDSYSRGALVVPAMVVAGHLVLIFNVSANYAIYRQRTRLVLMVSLVGTAISVALNLTLIPRWDIVGAAVAAVVATLWLAVGMTTVSLVVLKCPNLPAMSAAASAGLSCASLLLTWWLFGEPVIRLALAAVILTVVVVHVVRRLRTRTSAKVGSE